MLSIKNLEVSVEDEDILRGIDLEIEAGEIHALMGPNGSGKSTLAKVLAGREEYEVTDGSVTYKGIDLLDLEPEERAHAGIFMAFQYPVELPGVSAMNFLKTALNSIREANGKEELSMPDFMAHVKQKAEQTGIDEKLLRRAVNEGFSGGEKKKNEVFQMAVLEPTLAILDETDSGLDIDALQTVAGGVNRYHAEDNAILLVTHYQRILDYIVPDNVHVMIDGRLVKSGGPDLARQLEEKGYDWLREEAAATAA
jgi:Fe-S cluster assembly ATP-binding protein